MRITPARQTFWDWRAAMNFILGGTGSGLVLFAAVARASGAPGRPSILLGAMLIAAGLACVWFEIGRPARFLNVLRNPYTSWMSREAWVAVVLVPLAIAVVVLDHPALAAMLAIPAFGFLYCQGRILCASRGVPAWRHRGTGRLIVATGLAEGLAMYLILNDTGPARYAGWAEFVLACAVLLPAARGVCWWQWRASVQRDGPRISLESIRRFETAFLAAGTFLPILLIAAAWIAPGLASPLIWAACVSVLAAGWVLKYLLITRAAHTQGFALERTPARGGGRSGPGIRPGWS